MRDPLLEQLLAEAETIVNRFGVTNAEAADRAIGEDSLDLEADRDQQLRAALIAELDRRHGPLSADPEDVDRAAEEWAERGEIAVDDPNDR